MELERLSLDLSKTEEIQEIIDRMPSRFGYWISAIVVFLFTMLMLFGWLIRYPDVVTGQITINAISSPIKLISSVNGKLKLTSVKSMDFVKEGEIIGYIENSANPKSVELVKSLLKTFNPNGDVEQISQKLPRSLSLGELNTQFYGFSDALQQYANYKNDKLLNKQKQNLIALLAEQKQTVISMVQRVYMVKNSLFYTHKFFLRDSTLFKNKVISESEFDKTVMSYLSAKDALQNAMNNLSNAKQLVQKTEGEILSLHIQEPEKEKDLRIAIISSYNTLLDNMKNWEQKYLFKAPFAGKVQFLKFYNENQFVEIGEEVFTILPDAQKPIGQVILPAQGSGKIKDGQSVIIKLDNYPYLEYGSISGKVKSISLTTSTTKTDKNSFDTYMIVVDFPNQLTTNYGRMLAFKAEAKGTAEIITNDRRLIERFFGNLKYVMNK